MGLVKEAEKHTQVKGNCHFWPDDNLSWQYILRQVPPSPQKWCKQIKEAKSKWEVEEQWETKGRNWGWVSALREEIQMVDISSDS